MPETMKNLPENIMAEIFAQHRMLHFVSLLVVLVAAGCGRGTDSGKNKESEGNAGSKVWVDAGLQVRVETPADRLLLDKVKDHWEVYSKLNPAPEGELLKRIGKNPSVGVLAEFWSKPRPEDEEEKRLWLRMPLANSGIMAIDSSKSELYGKINNDLMIVYTNVEDEIVSTLYQRKDVGSEGDEGK